ncbi:MULTISPECIES: hypothetical protein [Clostridium]|uniref:hypothetical protein n=1 Tax=Clostridium TaxID=1485 RepID=UPI0008245CE6|nr:MULTISPECIES: hypothetical protein [Clostridium]PJI06583.1 hypothetical protein CUB90_01305 [Clostridium sp. CT7]
MKIAIATGMTELDEKICSRLKDNKDMIINVVNYREFFDKQNFNIAVISERLLGDMNLEQLFFVLKSKNTRIIYLTNADDVNGIKRCFKYSINDILFDPVKPEDIIKLILEPNSFADISDIYLKYSNMQLKSGEAGTPIKVIKESGGKPKVVEKVVEKIIEKPVTVKETIYKTKILKKKIITFYATDNALLPANLITQLGVLLSKRTNQKILILDFNTLFPIVDDFFGVKKEISIESKYDIGSSTSLVLMYNALERGNLNEGSFFKFVQKTKFKNLHVATGLYDLALFEKMPEEYFSKIIEIAYKIYDTILVNTNPDIGLASTFIPMLDSTDDVFIIEPNYTSIKNMLFVFSNLNNRISKGKIKVIVDNYSNSGLDSETIEKLLGDYKIIGYLPEDHRREEFLNRQKPFIASTSLKKSDVKPYLKLLEAFDYIKEPTFLDKFFKRGGVR